MYILPCILFSVFLNDLRFNSITSLNVKYICRWIGTIRNALNQILANLFKNHFPLKHKHAKYDTFTVDFCPFASYQVWKKDHLCNIPRHRRGVPVCISCSTVLRGFVCIFIGSRCNIDEWLLMSINVSNFNSFFSNSEVRGG